MEPTGLFHCYCGVSGGWSHLHVHMPIYDIQSEPNVCMCVFCVKFRHLFNAS